MSFLNKTLNIPCEIGLYDLPGKCADVCVTSPPYYALRDYGVPPSSWPEITYTLFGIDVVIPATECCLGLEPTPHAFIGHLLHVFRGVHHALKDDGTCWVNLGDSYSTGAGGGNMKNKKVQAMAGSNGLPGEGTRKDNVSVFRKPFRNNFIKSKDMMGIPWMFAFAMREDGWYLRQDIIWAKPNPMPESIQDRCTKSHEYIFLFSKSKKYYFDAEAIKTASIHEVTKTPDGWDTSKNGSHGSFHKNGRENNKVPSKHSFKRENSSRKDILVPGATLNCHRPDRNDTLPTGFANKRSVWNIATRPFKEAHFATFPEELVTDCIKAGSSQHGCCAACGNPYKRLVNKTLVPTAKASFNSPIDDRDLHADKQDQGSNRAKDGHKSGHIYSSETIGWVATCKCSTTEIKKAVVLDPFHGSGTVGIVSSSLARDHIAFEIKNGYTKLETKRRYDALGLFA